MGKHKYPDRFYSEPVAISAVCSDCVHRHKGMGCDAYPDRIPRDFILTRFARHGDPKVLNEICNEENGVHFEPNDTYDENCRIFGEIYKRYRENGVV